MAMRDANGRQTSIQRIRTRVFQLIDRAGDTPKARQERAGRRVQQVVGVLGLKIVMAYCFGIMLVIHVADVRRFAEDNWNSRTKIETRRGDILDRNGVTLATSLRADSVSVDPRWVLPPGYLPWRAPEDPLPGAQLIDEAAEAEAVALAQEEKKPKKRDKSKSKTMKFDDPIAVQLRATVAKRIAEVTATPLSEVTERLAKPHGFTYVAKHVDDQAARALKSMKSRGLLPGVTIQPDWLRYFPNNQLAGALIGTDQSTGSVEQSFDRILRGQVVELVSAKDVSAIPLYYEGAPDPGLYGGRSVKLTIDEKIQAVAEHHIRQAVIEREADFGIAVVMDVQTGDILALAETSGMNPNDTDKPPVPFGWHNIAIENQYEPGSTFKVFTVAAALQEKVLKKDEIIPISSPVVIGSKVIKDDHPHSQCNWWQCLQVSSNIAMSKIAMRMKKETFGDYLIKLGFSKRVDTGLTGEGAGQLAWPPDKWPLIQYANIAFGQGIAVTPLQIVAAYGTLASGGVYRRPRLVREVRSPDGRHDEQFPVDPGRRVYDAEVAKDTLFAMASVCQPKGENSLGGTGTQARMPNYSIGGKTGTAQQVDPKNGRYSETHWVGSFIGVTPIENPRLVVFAAVDNPKKFDPKLGKVMRYGGAIAAPVVREIGRFALPYLGVPPSPGAPYLDKNDPEKARRDDEARRLAANKAADQLIKKDAIAQIGAQMAAVAGASAPELQAAAKAQVGKPGQTVGNAAVSQGNMATATGNDGQALADAQAPHAGDVRVPDLRRLPMRSVRERLHAAGLVLEAHGSGVGTVQGPLPGAMVPKGTVVHVNFRRMSDGTDVPQPVALNSNP